mgnify:CR=1 FL=1
MTITDEMVEQAARVMWQCIYERDCAYAEIASAESDHLYAPGTLPFEECREQLMKDARRFMAPVAPLIRSAALEEAARVADELGKTAVDPEWNPNDYDDSDIHYRRGCAAVAPAIRSLKDKQPDTRTPTEGERL